MEAVEYGVIQVFYSYSTRYLSVEGMVCVMQRPWNVALLPRPFGVRTNQIGEFEGEGTFERMNGH